MKSEHFRVKLNELIAEQKKLLKHLENPQLQSEEDNFFNLLRENIRETRMRKTELHEALENERIATIDGNKQRMDYLEKWSEELRLRRANVSITQLERDSISKQISTIEDSLMPEVIQETNYLESWFVDIGYGWRQVDSKDEK